MDSSARTRISFFIPVLVGLGVFAAIVLPGALGTARFIAACLAFLIITPGGAWLLNRTLSTEQ